MAVIRNITADTLTLFRPDAPPVYPGDDITVRDDVFVTRAWPSSTWEVVEPPALEGYEQVEVADAHLWEIPAEPTTEPPVVEPDAVTTTDSADEPTTEEN